MEGKHLFLCDREAPHGIGAAAESSHLMLPMFTVRGSRPPAEGRWRRGLGGGDSERAQEGADQEPIIQGFTKHCSGALSWKTTKTR